MTPLTENAPSCNFEAISGASESAVAGLSGSVLARRFRHWRAADGGRYLFSVFQVGPGATLEDVPRFEDAVVLAVSRDAAGSRRILFADETGPLPDLLFSGANFRAAIAAGANEVHVHLLTETATGRATLLRNLVGE